jgi:hypothetical protein
MNAEYNWPAFGKIAFETYWENSGQPPVAWEDLNEQTQAAWIQSAKMVCHYFGRAATA